MMFLRFQRGKNPIERPRALCSGSPSSCYSLPKDLGSVFPALQHGAVVTHDVAEPAGVPGWALCCCSGASQAVSQQGLLLVSSSQQGILSTLNRHGYVLNEIGHDSSKAVFYTCDKSSAGGKLVTANSDFLIGLCRLHLSRI